MNRHSEKLIKAGMIKNENDLEELYGWELERMIRDIRHALKEGCSYCLQKIDAIEQGLGSVTLDIFDPKKPPHYSTNVHWCCARCNAEKQNTTPDVWGARLSMWDRWRRHQVRVEDNPEKYGFLNFKKKAEQAHIF